MGGVEVETALRLAHAIEPRSTPPKGIRQPHNGAPCVAMAHQST